MVKKLYRRRALIDTLYSPLAIQQGFLPGGCINKNQSSLGSGEPPHPKVWGLPGPVASRDIPERRITVRVARFRARAGS